jgi:hypothetical protein
MSQLSKGILGAIAVSLTFGAVQFALGHDLSLAPALQNPKATTETAVNRAAKADRAARATAASVQTRTVSLRLDGLSDTSIVVRIPIAAAARNSSSGRPATKSGSQKPTVACEPVVSVLTEIAKQLQPGRCIT